MKAKGITKNENSEWMAVLNRMLRTLDFSPYWRMCDDSEMLEDTKYKLTDYLKLNRVTDEDARTFIKRAFGFIEERGISDLDIVENKYDFNSIVTNDIKIDESININGSKRIKKI